MPEFQGFTDPKDVHVAAGALKLRRLIGARPVVLVTMNTRHLPKSAFEGTKILVTRPGPFLKELLASDLRVLLVLEVGKSVLVGRNSHIISGCAYWT